jgi:hypothetical protein
MPFPVCPLHDATLIFSETLANKILGGPPIRVGGSCRNVRFAPKSFSQVPVGAANVFFQGVAAFRLVGRQIACAGVLARPIALGGFGWLG